MSRIGFKPVVLPEGVTAELVGGVMTVKGPKGELNVSIPALVVAPTNVNFGRSSRIDRAPAPFPIIISIQ